MSTKSGSNDWHGSAYEYLRNTKLNANDFFVNRNQSPREKLNQNQYGVLLSGPIKKDKLFAMFSWENFSLRMGSPYEFNVPSADQLAGKFYRSNPSTAAVGGAFMAPDGCITQGLTDAKGTYDFVNPSCFDSTAKAMLKYFPAANHTPTSSANYNYFTVPTTSTDTTEYIGRVDYNLSDKQRLFARYAYWTLDDVTPSFFSSTTYDTGYARPHNITHSVVIGDSYAFTPYTVLDVRLSYMREDYSNVPPNLGKVDLSQFGAAYAAMASEMTFQELPNVYFEGSENLPNICPMDSTSYATNNNLVFNANMTKIQGRHTLKFGGEVRYMDRSAYGTTLAASTFNIFMAGPYGDELAAFLLGAPVVSQLKTASPTTTFNYSQGYYINDTWQATSRLTLNLGVRYELLGGLAEKKDRATVLLPDTVDPVTGYKGTMGLTNSSLYSSRSVIPVRHDLFAPRFGFAQRFGDSTVLRGGYGISYIPNGLQPGVLSENSPINSFQNQSSYHYAYHSLSDPFDVLNGGTFSQPSGRNDPNWTKNLLGQTPEGVVSDLIKVSYVQQWNLSLGHQWRGGWMTEVSYMGTKGTHLPENGAISNNDTYMGLDQVSDSILPSLQAQENALSGLSGSALTAAVAKITAQGQATRPYQQFSDYWNTGDYSGSTIYHGMTMKLEKRFNNGGIVSANYTWSKMIGNTDAVSSGGAERSNGGYIQDFQNLSNERSLSNFDTPHRFVLSLVYNLPFGKGQKFAQYKGFAGKLVSGWSVNNITTFASGRPLSLYYGSSTILQGSLGAGTVRPNYVAGCTKAVSGSAESRLNGWFNAACFTSAGDYTFGNESRVDSELRSQGTNNFDVSILKESTISERTKFQLRFEFFNIFNHPVFSAPGTQIDGSNYNVVTSQANHPRLVQISLRLNF